MEFPLPQICNCHQVAADTCRDTFPKVTLLLLHTFPLEKPRDPPTGKRTMQQKKKRTLKSHPFHSMAKAAMGQGGFGYQLQHP